MRHEQGDLWERYERGQKVVITTNVGWDPQTLRNNMGAGMALQAARRWPWLPEWYGRFCRHWITRRDASVMRAVRAVPVVELDRLIFFPVKPLLDFRNPERSWDQKARLDTIRVSLSQLTRHEGAIALAFPGCGNGGLKPAEVLPFLQQFLCADRFTICDWEFPVSDLEHRIGMNAAAQGLFMLNDALAHSGLSVRDGQLVRQ